MERIIVIGAGGLAKQAFDTVERTDGREIVGVVAPDRSVGDFCSGYPVLGGDDQMAQIVVSHRIDGAIVAIGDNWRRARAAQAVQMAVPGLPLLSAVDPAARVARGAIIGRGVLIATGAVIDSDVRLGDFALVSIGGFVGHDAVVGDFTTIGAGAIIGGATRVGDYTAIGMGANIIHRIAIGEHTVVGAGSTVVRDLPAYTVAYGSPARAIRQRQQGEPYL